VADAFAVKVHIGLGFDGDAVYFFGGHGFLFLNASNATVKRPVGASGKPMILVDYRAP